MSILTTSGKKQMKLGAGLQKMHALKDLPDRDIKKHIPLFVKKIITRLHKAGFKAYIIGGAVRDFYMYRPVTDWDVATSASSGDIRSVFWDISSFCLKHETVTLVHGKANYEITSFKSLPAIEDDLGHRDFTINAIAYDPVQELIIDPFEGLSDMKKGLVKAVRDPVDRFREDPLRIMRGIRLSVELDFRIEKETLAHILGMADELSSVARERVRDELIKIMLCPRPSRGFNIMRRSGLLKQLIPELLEGYLKRQNRYHKFTVYRHIMETVDQVSPVLHLRLAALFHDIGKPRVRRRSKKGFVFHGHEEVSSEMARSIMGRLRFSKDLTNKVSHLVSLHEIFYDRTWSKGAIRRLMQRAGQGNMEDLLALRRADLIAHGIRDNQVELISELEKRIDDIRQGSFVEDLVGLAIGGGQVMEILGIDQGPDVGRVLGILMEKVTDEPELNTYERLSNLVKSMKKGGKG